VTTTWQSNDGRVQLYRGDCLDVMRGLASCSIDSIVTDPPAGIGFMGNGWDSAKGGRDQWIAWMQTIAAEALRVVKPGAHALVWALPRTAHWTATAWENAGWEIRDVVHHLFGSGFPKSHNLSGDKAGWGTALKPACENWILMRRPLDGTVAANVQANGTGALNIDACRIKTEDDLARPAPSKSPCFRTPELRHATESNPLGRWPANVCHDGSDEVMAGFPDTPGAMSPVGLQHKSDRSAGILKLRGMRRTVSDPREDAGSAARFFYCAKASRADRDEGLDGFEERPCGMMQDDGHKWQVETVRRNTHPTVKATALMSWLIRLVTPPGGVVLDPFMGSGSTGKAAVLEGFRFIGCEQADEYFEIAKNRVTCGLTQPVIPGMEPEHTGRLR
jgi:site-specific DNA-methyltransferase (adenine-specific)